MPLPIDDLASLSRADLSGDDKTIATLITGDFSLTNNLAPLI